MHSFLAFQVQQDISLPVFVQRPGHRLRLVHQTRHNICEQILEIVGSEVHVPQLYDLGLGWCWVQPGGRRVKHTECQRVLGMILAGSGFPSASLVYSEEKLACGSCQISQL